MFGREMGRACGYGGQVCDGHAQLENGVSGARTFEDKAPPSTLTLCACRQTVRQEKSGQKRRASTPKRNRGVHHMAMQQENARFYYGMRRCGCMLSVESSNSRCRGNRHAARGVQGAERR
jgi:hypothetical protein